MIECHDLPTAKPYRYSAVYYPYVNNTRQTGQTLTYVVLYDKQGSYSGELQPSMLGTIRKVQISTTYLATQPNYNDIITIDGRDYKFSTITKKASPVFTPFWECEIKTTTV